MSGTAARLRSADELRRMTAPGLLLERLDYAQVLREIISELQADLMARNCRLELEGEVPSVRLRLDPKCLRRVLINLTNNAADATGPRGLLSLRCRLEHSGVVTELEDNGPGIAPEIIGRLFEAFATHGKPARPQTAIQG